MTRANDLARTHARKLAKGSSFIAFGVAVGVVLAQHDVIARALACAVLVVEIGSAVVVMRRGIRAIDRLEKSEAEATLARLNAAVGDDDDTPNPQPIPLDVLAVIAGEGSDDE